jgi:hypothetical protein
LTSFGRTVVVFLATATRATITVRAVKKASSRASQTNFDQRLPVGLKNIGRD